MTERQLELLTDARLSDTARVLGLHLSTLGDGDHELSHDRLAAMVHGTPNADTIGKHMRQLRVHGYVERTSLGGRGSPRYRWHENSAREIPRVDDPLPVKNHGQTPTVVGSSTMEVKPPLVPLSEEPLDERTEKAIEQHGVKLAGCRGALRDYLRIAVPTPTRRYAYVQTVATWLDGGDPSVWKLPTGASLPPPDRPRVLAAALNEMAAGDERQMKRPVGDPGNLKTKLNVLLKQRSDHGGSGNGTNGAHSGRAATPSRAAPPGPGANPKRLRTFGADDDQLDNAG